MIQGAAPDTLREHLSALEQSLLDPRTRADADSVADLLTDEFVEFGGSGRIWTKAATISQLAVERPDPSVKRLVADLDVRLLADDVALVTYALTRRSPREVDASTLRSSIWTCAEGRWRMTFHQGTIVEPASE
jgi:hypothetical protein